MHDLDFWDFSFLSFYYLWSPRQVVSINAHPWSYSNNYSFLVFSIEPPFPYLLF